jgi:hypothetical protein
MIGATMLIIERFESAKCGSERTYHGENHCPGQVMLAIALRKVLGMIRAML